VADGLVDGSLRERPRGGDLWWRAC
jgi:hypothetical protein